jgi:hypothetical protein
MDQSSIGVEPAGGAPCPFQRSESTYDSTERVHDAIRQRVFWCWQVYDGKPTAAGERLAQSIDRPFRHVGRCHVEGCGTRSRLCAGGDLGRYLLRVGAVAAVLEAGAAAPGDATQDRDLVEIARLALAGDADDSFARTIDGPQAAAGAGQQIERFVQQANGASWFQSGRIRPHMSQGGPFTTRGRLHKLVDHRRVRCSFGLEHANVACLGFEQAPRRNHPVCSRRTGR